MRARFHAERERELNIMRERYALDSRFHFTAELIRQFVRAEFEEKVPEWDLLRLTTTIADTWGPRERQQLPRRDTEGRTPGTADPGSGAPY